MIIVGNAIIAFFLYIYTINYNIDEKRLLKFIVFTALLLQIIFFISLRGVSAGLDTPYYVEAYQGIHSFSSSYTDASSIFGSKEPLFWYYAGFSKSILHLTANQWIALTSIISYLLFYAVYKRMGNRLSINITVPFVLLFFTYFFVAYGNIMRQMIALPFLFLAILSFENKKYFLFITYSLFAIGFHISSMIIVFYPLYKRIQLRYSTLLLISMLIFFIGPKLIDLILTIIHNSYLLEKWTLYSTSYISPYGPMYKRPTTMLTLLILIAYVVVFSKEHYSNLLFSVNLFFSCILIATAFNPGISERFIVYIYFLLPITLWMLTTKFQTDYQIFLSRLLIILFFYFQSIYIFSKEGVLFTLGITNGTLL